MVLRTKYGLETKNWCWGRQQVKACCEPVVVDFPRRSSTYCPDRPQGIHVAHVVIDGQIYSQLGAGDAAKAVPDNRLDADEIAEVSRVWSGGRGSCARSL